MWEVKPVEEGEGEVDEVPAGIDAGGRLVEHVRVRVQALGVEGLDVLGGLLLVDMPGTEAGGAADFAELFQEGMEKRFQANSIAEIESEIAGIQQRYLDEDSDVFAVITIEGHELPHPTHPFRTLLFPIKTTVVPLPLSPGAKPAVLNPQGREAGKFRYTRIEQVLRRGRPIRRVVY